jgi:hypothetical protein
MSSLDNWRRSRNWKPDPATAPKDEKKVEPTPAPEPEVEMDDETRAFDLGNTGPASIEEQEILEDVRRAEERNPGGVAFARMIVESMEENDRKHGRTR